MATERKPVPFNRFGGVRLDLPLDEVGPEAAIFARDVDWDFSPGGLRPRDGFQKLKTAEATGDYKGIFPHNAFRLLSIKRISAESKKVVAIDSLGAEKAEANWTASVGRPCFARFGTPSASYTYMRASGVTGHKVVRFDGTTFTEPTATVDGAAGKEMPRGAFMVTWPDGGNRLAVFNTGPTGGPNGAASSNSHGWFSDPGNAESWHTVAPEANYVQFSPGDGEEIVGACLFNGQIFVFKETQIFVVYGVSTDEEGAPVFNFRSVQLGEGSRIRRASHEALAESSDQICAATDSGVYFVTTDGVYLTTGGQPVKISEDLRPLDEGSEFGGPMAEFLNGATEVGRWPAAGITALGRRLYVKRYEFIFVYDLDMRGWLPWRMTNVSMAVWGAIAGGNLSGAAGFAGTVANDAAIGSKAWSNLNNAKADDSLYASIIALAPGETSQYIKLTNYGLSVPETATVRGVVVKARRRGAGSAPVGGIVMQDASIRLVSGGAINGTEKSEGASWPTGPPNEYSSYGSSSDLHGLALTPAIVNASNFGVAIAVKNFHATKSGNAEFNSAEIAVYYTMPESQSAARPRLFCSRGKHIYWTGPGAAADDGLRDAQWQAGFYDLGSEDEKALVEAKIWGRGEIDFSSFRDFGEVPEFTDSLTLEPAAGDNTTQARSHSSGKPASLFSHRLRLAAGARVQRIVRYLQVTRVATTKSGK